ncbi:MAG: F0F1 ATP synthase subunit A [Deltaproteobacteria bacterium]|nr:F0F1 ATP synthase subunit A [Deltaproteobacteria bacterium]
MDFNFLIWLGEHVKILSWINEHTIHIASAGFVAFSLLIISFLAGLKLRNIEKCLVPSKKISLATLFDAAAEAILNLLEGVMPARQGDIGGGRAIKFLPLIGSIFVYIFCCNLLSVVPGFVPPTDNINTNLPIALTVFIYYHVMGLREHGIKGYLKHFAGPIIWLAPLMFSLEIVSHCVRPVSLSVRLFGNITGDHMVLGIFSNLTPLFIPVIFLLLALFVAFIQAFVFSLLSTVYIALATEHEGH